MSRFFDDLPNSRANVIVSDPSCRPDLIVQPLVDNLRARGRLVHRPELGSLPAAPDVLVLSDTAAESPHRLMRELPELDRWARNHATTVVIPWRLEGEAESMWIEPAAARCAWCVHVQDIVFGEPPDVIPSGYLIPLVARHEGKVVARVSHYVPI